MPTAACATAASRRETWLVLAILGPQQILSWGSSFYLLTVLAGPIVGETGWPLAWVVGGLSIGLAISGLVSPLVGRRIERLGGRAMLPLGCALLAAGQILMGLAESLWLFEVAWALMGLGMASSLYDPAFATLGRQFGLRARGLITVLTLFGGFASTVCWPLSAALVEWVGWRDTCFVYAGLHLLAILPLRRVLRPPPPHAPLPPEGAAPAASVLRRLRLLLAAAGLTFATAYLLLTVVAVHLVPLLAAREIAVGTAVALGALIGPSQVGARLLELLFGRRLDPLWSLITATLPMAVGLGLVAGGPPGWLPVALVVYGGGVGISSVARGTVPLALVGQRGYAAVMGKLVAPSLVLQAVAPVAAAWVIEGTPGGAALLLWLLFGVALANLALACWLTAAARRFMRQRSPRSS